MVFVSSDKAKRYLRSLPRCQPADLQQLWPAAKKEVGRAVACTLKVGFALEMMWTAGSSSGKEWWQHSQWRLEIGLHYQECEQFV